MNLHYLYVIILETFTEPENGREWDYFSKFTNVFPTYLLRYVGNLHFDFQCKSSFTLCVAFPFEAILIFYYLCLRLLQDCSHDCSHFVFD